MANYRYGEYDGGPDPLAPPLTVSHSGALLAHGRAARVAAARLGGPARPG